MAGTFPRAVVQAPVDGMSDTMDGLHFKKAWYSLDIWIIRSNVPGADGSGSSAVGSSVVLNHFFLILKCYLSAGAYQRQPYGSAVVIPAHIYQVYKMDFLKVHDLSFSGSILFFTPASTVG